MPPVHDGPRAWYRSIWFTRLWYLAQLYIIYHILASWIVYPSWTEVMQLSDARYYHQAWYLCLGALWGREIFRILVALKDCR